MNLGQGHIVTLLARSEGGSNSEAHSGWVNVREAQAAMSLAYLPTRSTLRLTTLPFASKMEGFNLHSQNLITLRNGKAHPRSNRIIKF